MKERINEKIVEINSEISELRTMLAKEHPKAPRGNRLLGKIDGLQEARGLLIDLWVETIKQ